MDDSFSPIGAFVGSAGGMDALGDSSDTGGGAVAGALAGSTAGNSIDRAVAVGNSDSGVVIPQALNILNDPDNGMDFQTRMHLAEPLLRAQHFGQGGGLQPGQSLNFPEPGSQGTIKSGKMSGGNAGGVMGLVKDVAAAF